MVVDDVGRQMSRNKSANVAKKQEPAEGFSTAIAEFEKEEV